MVLFQEYTFFFIIVFAKLGWLDCKYELKKEVLLTSSENKINGLFSANNKKVSFVIRNEGVFEIDFNNQFVKKGLIQAQSGILSLVILPVKPDKFIIASGVFLLYFADQNYNPIGTPIPFSDGDGASITSNSILEMYNQEVLFLYSKKKDENKIDSYISLYQISPEENNFEVEWTIFFSEWEESAPDNYYAWCNFFEEGGTILCIDILKRKQIVETIIFNKEDGSYLSKEEMGSTALNIKMVKLTEYSMCVVSYNAFNIVFLFFYDVFYQKANYLGQYQIPFLTVNVDIFSVARKDDNTVVIAELDSGSCIVHFIIYSGIFDITHSSFVIPNLNVKELRIISFNQNIFGIMLKNNVNEYQSVIFEVPQCNQLSFNMFSREIRIFELEELTQDQEDLRIYSVFSSSGISSIREERSIQYTAPNYGFSTVDYILESNINQFRTKVCRIEVQTCNIACSECSIFSFDSFNPLCTRCSDDYYPLENDTSKCFDKLSTVPGFYFDEETEKFERCYYSCKNCYSKGTNLSHNCISCSKNYFDFDVDSKNCVCNTNIQQWYDEDGYNICVEECPAEVPYLNHENIQCITQCDDLSSYNKRFFFNCLDECPKGTTEVNNQCLLENIDDIMKNIDTLIEELYKNKRQKKFLNGSSTFTYEIFEFPKENNNNKLLTTIELGNCEESIKEGYSISKFLVFKVDIEKEGEVARQIEYRFYTEDFKPIDLNVCKDMNIKVRVPIPLKKQIEINLEEAEFLQGKGHDLYDSSDQFYNDICLRYTSINGKDVSIQNRRNFIYKRVNFCEKDCEFKGINYTFKEFYCLCKIKLNMISESRGYNESLVNTSFQKKINNENFRCILCFKKAFDKNIYKNIGFWVALILYLMQIMLLCIFLCKEKGSIENKMKNIMSRKNPQESIERAITPSDTLTKIIVKSHTKFYKNSNTQLMDKKLKKKAAEKNISTSKKDLDSQSSITIQNGVLLQLKQTIKDNILKGIEGGLTLKNRQFQRKGTLPKKFKIFSKEDSDQGSRVINEGEIEKEKIQYSEIEYSSMSYREAMKKDKRGFFCVYLSLIKNKQIIIITFLSKNDNNSLMIKISLFTFNIICLIIFNACFYLDNVMTHYFLSTSCLDIGYMIPTSIYSAICTNIFNILLKHLSFLSFHMKNVRGENEQQKTKQIRNCYRNHFKILLVLFFLIQYIIHLIGVFYISIFCYVYVNSIKILFMKAFISFIMVLIIPFFSCFGICILRFLAYKEKSKMLFVISNIFAFL